MRNAQQVLNSGFADEGKARHPRTCAGRKTHYSEILSYNLETVTEFHKIGINHIFTLGLAQFFYQFQHLCLSLGAPNPIATQAIVDLLSDRASFVDNALRAIFSLPYFLFANRIGRVSRIIGLGRNKFI